MKRATRTMAICAAFSLVGFTGVSCTSTPPAAEEAPSTSGLTIPQREVSAAEPQETPTNAPYAERAVPFSEERVNALEGSLKPLDSVPLPGGEKIEEESSASGVKA